MPNPVVHFELTGADKAKLQDFYRAAFGWSVNADNPMGYGMVEADGGQGIGGGVDGDAPGVTIYIQVDDPAAYLEKVKSLGGKVVMDVTVIPGMVTMAKFEDVAGNVVGLVKAE